MRGRTATPGSAEKTAVTPKARAFFGILSQSYNFSNLPASSEAVAAYLAFESD